MSSPSVDLQRDLIVIGGSAGALSLLRQVISELPADLAAAIVIVVHQSQLSPGRMPHILSSGVLPVGFARDGERIELGHVYVAPPDYHLLIERGTLRLSRGPKENRFRPAIDPLFRTAARAYGSQAIGVILSGFLDDGTLGLMRVKQFGGTTVVQHPDTAEARGMPTSALANVGVDYVVTPSEMAGLLQRLVLEPSLASPQPGAQAMSAPLSESAKGVPSKTGDTAERGDMALLTGRLGGPPSGLTCPECGGALWEQAEGGLLTFRCHVGHAYTADSMALAHDSQLESTMWAALRMFQENAALHHRMASKAKDSGNVEIAGRFAERATEQEGRADLMRKLLLGEAHIEIPR
jgi:two-component system chemotaxis response regulator CheB